MKRILLIPAMTMAALVLWSGVGNALLPEMTREELIEKCDGIILGTVQDVRCAWAEDHSQIFTYVNLAIQDQFKGTPVGSQLTIQIPGGTVGEITQWVSDTPTVVVGTTVIIHTFMKETGYPWIYGWEKGVLTVENGVIPEYNMTVDQFRSLVETTMNNR